MSEHLMGYPSNIGPPDLVVCPTCGIESFQGRRVGFSGPPSKIFMSKKMNPDSFDTDDDVLVLSVARGLRAVLDHIEGSGHACCECSDNTIWDGPISGLVEIFQKGAAKE